jgi:hypothetical protein
MPTKKLNVNPSVEWTADERLAVIASLSAPLEVAIRLWKIPQTEVFDTVNRILIISTADAGFLEANRSKILEFKEVI